MIRLNENGINNFEGQGWSDCIKRQYPTICCLWEVNFKY